MSPRRQGLEALFDRSDPSMWQSFIASPLKYLANALYHYQARRQAAIRPPEKKITIACISDTHNTQPPIPDADLFIHAGDLTQSGSATEIQEALTWIQSLSHIRHKIVIAGNHDIALNSDDRSHSNFQWGGITYLQDGRTRINFSNGRYLSVFGSPWTPTPGPWVFQYPRNEDVWTRKVPEDTDVLVTHMPPRFHLDVAGFGDDNLLKELRRVRPKVHVFGHVHGGWGREFLIYDRFEACYEDICRGSGGFLALLKMWICFVGFFWRARSTRGTVLVNAAAVGGLRDEKRRKPILISI